MLIPQLLAAVPGIKTVVDPVSQFPSFLDFKTLACRVIALRQDDSSQEKLTDPREEVYITDTLRICNQVARFHIIALP